ncbi:MAG TPA: MotA/TolQ/ExbB proton channel family protein [Polyangiaceae bacterium]
MRRRALLILLGCWFVLFGQRATAAPAPAPAKPASAPAKPGVSLETAYRREFAFLEAERSSLQQRVSELDADAQKKIAAAEGEVSALQSQVMATSLEADRLNDVLNRTASEVETASEGDDVLGGLVSQAAAALEKGGIKLPAVQEGDEKAQISQVEFVFGQGLSLLQRYGSIRKESGAFFDAQGKKVTGEILRIGSIASYGVAGQAAGALAPAGEDGMKVWPEVPSAETARALAQGQSPERLQIFLYENLDKPIEAKLEKTFLEYVNSGGPIAWVIVVLGVVCLLLILLRAAFLWLAASNTDKLIEEITPLIESGKIEQAIETCGKKRGAAGRVLTATLKHLDSPRDHLEDVISESILHETPFLDRFGSTILVLAAVAPLLGLLGTVTGMIATFDVITEFGTGNPKLLSGGISEALITTEFGLMVAIPALLAGNLLGGWAGNIKDALDKGALRVSNIAAGIRVSVRPAPAPAFQPEPRLHEAT